MEALAISLLLGLLGLYFTFVFTMYSALACCAPETRDLHPNWAWIMFSPLSQIAGLVLVFVISSSLDNEARRLEISPRPSPGNMIGLLGFALGAADVLLLKANSPLSWINGLACLICYVAYWRGLRRCIRTIKAAKVPSAPNPTQVAIAQ
jgi:vacuolar-type H+-ATPase subunit I/STV1